MQMDNPTDIMQIWTGSQRTTITNKPQTFVPVSKRVGTTRFVKSPPGYSLFSNKAVTGSGGDFQPLNERQANQAVKSWSHLKLGELASRARLNLAEGAGAEVYVIIAIQQTSLHMQLLITNT